MQGETRAAERMLFLAFKFCFHVFCKNPSLEIRLFVFKKECSRGHGQHFALHPMALSFHHHRHYRFCRAIVLSAIFLESPRDRGVATSFGDCGRKGCSEKITLGQKNNRREQWMTDRCMRTSHRSHYGSRCTTTTVCNRRGFVKSDARALWLFPICRELP